MKSRRVTLTLEVETDAPLLLLRKADQVHVTVTGVLYDVKVLQAQANVIKTTSAVNKRRC